MMKTKTQKEYVDTGFGFPVVLLNVPMVKVRGQWSPHVNHQQLVSEVLRQVMLKKTRLTGNEVRFIRLQLEMTLAVFAARFDVTHPAVLKWERTGNQPTKMNWATEKDIRLFICDCLLKPGSFTEAYRALEPKPKAKRTTRPRINFATLQPA